LLSFVAAHEAVSLKPVLCAFLSGIGKISSNLVTLWRMHNFHTKNPNLSIFIFESLGI
jgi:hypothetical protein